MKDLKSAKEVFWINKNYSSFETIEKNLPISYDEIIEAEIRLKRFAPYIQKAFPEVINGVIESPILSVNQTKDRLEEYFNTTINGDLLLKRDDLLPIAGSIKARGGVYEVLKFAEKLALNNNLLNLNENYSILLESRFKKFFSQYTIQVGSTGNLGLSIGIISAKVGFKVIVHMSSDAKQWKKDLLRSKSVEVLEYSSDYSEAVEKGRALSNQDPKSYFIDDENSKDLFIGYALGGIRLEKQLEDMKIFIDEDNPLFVYLPCGVGGGPGGIAYGLKLIYGDNVQCFFAEPTNSPAMLLGLSSGLHDRISVEDIGLSNKTEADGLAVGRPSSFVGKIMDRLLSGIFTIDDYRLHDFLKILYQEEGIFLEPSALAGFLGPLIISKYYNKKSTHICWGTGGSLVPHNIRKQLI